MLAALALTPAPASDSTSKRASTDDASNASAPDVAAARLEHLRRTADVRGQRAHGWDVFASLAARDASHRGGMDSWHAEDAAFAERDSAGGTPAGVRGFASVVPRSSEAPVDAEEQSADTSPFVYTVYNAAAYAHIRRHRLFDPRELDRLRGDRSHDGDPYGRPSVPPFPRDAVVVKSAWWPVARDRATPLPVWDSALNPPDPAGNGLVGWARVVAVEPSERGESDASATVRDARISFAGESRPIAARASLADFHAVTVDAALAAQLQRDPDFRKLAVLVLGRAMSAGDHLVLVGAHVATREIDDWIWLTVWWHDAASVGPYAAGRPPSLATPWRNYLLDVAFDASAPAAPDGGPHASFNPWFEARFPDGGHGGGTASNCMACHRRATYPAVPFLPVTRGEPHVRSDAAYAADRLATNSLWSIARRAER